MSKWPKIFGYVTSTKINFWTEKLSVTKEPMTSWDMKNIAKNRVSKWEKFWLYNVIEGRFFEKINRVARKWRKFLEKSFHQNGSPDLKAQKKHPPKKRGSGGAFLWGICCPTCRAIKLICKNNLEVASEVEVSGLKIWRLDRDENHINVEKNQVKITLQAIFRTGKSKLRNYHVQGKWKFSTKFGRQAKNVT